jgi:hypothetical protein
MPTRGAHAVAVAKAHMSNKERWTVQKILKTCVTPGTGVYMVWTVEDEKANPKTNFVGNVRIATVHSTASGSTTFMYKDSTIRTTSRAQVHQAAKVAAQQEFLSGLLVPGEESGESDGSGVGDESDGSEESDDGEASDATTGGETSQEEGTGAGESVETGGKPADNTSGHRKDDLAPGGSLAESVEPGGQPVDNTSGHTKDDEAPGGALAECLESVGKPADNTSLPTPDNTKESQPPGGASAEAVETAAKPAGNITDISGPTPYGNPPTGASGDAVGTGTNHAVSSAEVVGDMRLLFSNPPPPPSVDVGPEMRFPLSNPSATTSLAKSEDLTLLLPMTLRELRAMESPVKEEKKQYAA